MIQNNLESSSQLLVFWMTYQYSINHIWYTSWILWTKWCPYFVLLFFTCTYFTALILKLTVTTFTLHALMYWNALCFWKFINDCVYGKCLLFIIMTTCPTCGRKVLSHACYVQCRSCGEYYHMKCISLERNMQADIHNSKCDWLCSNCLADIFPFNQIEDENEFIDECQLRMKASLEISDLIYNPFESNSSNDRLCSDFDPDINLYAEKKLFSGYSCRYYLEDQFNEKLNSLHIDNG